jgi:hypothetical protein
MKRIFAITALCLALLPLAAQDSGQAYGLPLLGQKSSGGMAFLRLQDSAKTEFLLSAQAEPDAKRMKAILSLLSSLRSWPAATLAEARVVNYEDRFQLLALVSEFELDSQNIAANIPGGILFTYDQGGYEYDFRVKAGGLLVRVKGLYASMDDVATVVARVIKDPAGFVLASDPLYSIKHFGELEARATQLETRATQLEADKAKLVAQNSDLTAANGALAARLDAADAALKAEDAANLENTRALLMAIYNGNKPVRPEVLKKVQEIKAADPSLVDKAKIATKVKDAGIKDASSREIEAVLFVYYSK